MQPFSAPGRPIRYAAQHAAPLVYDELSDPALVSRAKAGDERALAALCRRHAPRIERLAHHLLPDREDARDAAQEALAKLVVRIRQFRGESHFATWLHRLVVNTCRDLARAGGLRRTEPLLADERAADGGDPFDAVSASETRRELGRYLAELPPIQARVVALKDVVGAGFAEIAAATGLPVGTAKSHAHRGRAALRERLSA